MKFLELLIERKIYLITNVLIWLLGIFLIYVGLTSCDKTWGAINISIGTSLIAAAIVTFLELWNQIAISKIMQSIKNVILDSGINSIYDKRDLDKYDQLIRNLNQSLDVTGYSLSAFYESYSDILKEKCAINPILKIRILFVDPDSEFSRHRAFLEEIPTGSYKDRVERLTNHFKDYPNIEIKKISTPLTTMIFRIDDTLFVGPHLYKKPSKSTVTMELSNKGWLFNEYIQEFERLWNDGSDF